MEITTDKDFTRAMIKHSVDSDMDTLKLMQNVVGGMIEVFPNKVEIQGKTYVMIINEEGVLLRLPVNPMASEIANYPICGPCLIVRENVWKEWNKEDE